MSQFCYRSYVDVGSILKVNWHLIEVIIIIVTLVGAWMFFVVVVVFKSV